MGSEMCIRDREPEDAGEMKVPTLRNVALRKRFMHTGEFSGLGAAIGFYVSPTALEGRDEIPGAGVYNFSLGEDCPVRST